MIDPVQIDDRIVKCKKILELDPNSQIFAALAEAHRKKGELERAFRVCQNGLRIHPSYGSAHIVMAKINLDRRLFDWAEIEANKAAEIDGRTRSIELLLAEIYIYKGDFNRAIKLLKRLRQTDPDNSQIKSLLEIAEKLPEEQKELVEQTTSNPATKPEVASTAEPTAGAAEIVDEREVLRQAIRIAGVAGALYSSLEGLVAESEWSLAADSAIYGVAMGDIGQFLGRELVRTEFGDFVTILIESEQHTHYVVRAGSGLFIFVASADANLGTLRMKIENVLSNYQHTERG